MLVEGQVGIIKGNDGTANREIPPIFWRFLSNELKHTGQTLYPNPQVLFIRPNGMVKTTYVHFHL